MKIKTLDTLEDVQKLDGLLGDYIRFVCDDLERAAGLTFDADVLLANTVRSLSKVIPPEGQTFVAETEDGDILGMVFLRPSGNHDMEIKRLYVVPEGRGTGAGRALVEAAMTAARATGARSLRLDTAKNLKAAIGLYEDMGFAYRAPYPESDHFRDDKLLPYLVFMEKRL